MNRKMLFSSADSFDARIWSQHSIPIQMIQYHLDFLDDDLKDDELYLQQFIDIKNSLFNLYEEKIRNSQDKNLIDFFHNCKKIYDTYQDIDLSMQVAVQILFKAVWDQYVVHLDLINSTQHLLPTRAPEILAPPPSNITKQFP